MEDQSREGLSRWAEICLGYLHCAGTGVPVGWEGIHTEPDGEVGQRVRM